MSQLGRISGPLLTDNLLRNGVDLAFDTDLLYLKVGPAVVGSPGGGPGEDGDPNPTAGPRGIGINNDAPTDQLTITGTSNVSNDVIVTGPSATIDRIVINANGSFTTTIGPINIRPTGPDAYVNYGTVTTTDFKIKDNYISVTSGTNTDLRLNANGIGLVEFQSNTAIAGDLEVTQNIRSNNNVQLNGQFIIGNSPIDTVTISPDFTQSIIPGAADSYDLGTALKRWDQLWLTNEFNVQTVSITELLIDNQVRFTGNSITSIISNQDVDIVPSTGITQIERLTIQSNNVTNLDSTPISITHAGNGYLQFSYNTAFVIPVGTNAERRNNEVGETRWNTDLQYLECFDGTVWQVATGGGVVVTAPIMENLTHQYTLIFG